MMEKAMTRGKITTGIDVILVKVLNVEAFPVLSSNDAKRGKGNANKAPQKIIRALCLACVDEFLK